MKNLLVLVTGAIFAFSGLTGCCTAKAKSCPVQDGKSCCAAKKKC